MRSSKGIDIKNSTVKIFSTLGNAYALGTSGNTILIQDSAVTVDVYSDFVRDYNNSLELQILGNSTVYVQSVNSAMCGNLGENVRKYFALSEGGSDGKITGTTADMEYSTDKAFTSPISCVDGETTGLDEGTYYVRYKATTTLEPSHYATVKVMDNTVTVTDGAGEKVKKCKSGETVTIKVTVPTGKEFVKWSCTGISLPAAELEKEEITFTMPDNDVTLTATFEDSIYNITVTNGTSSAPTAKYQEEITVTANAPDTDEYFDKWEVTELDTTGMDLTKTKIKFQMPAGNVTFIRLLQKREVKL